MKKVIVRKQESIVQAAVFEQELGVHEFIELLKTQHPWGKPERLVLHKDEPMAEAYDEADVLEEKLEEVSPAVDAVLDDQGQEVSPAQPAVHRKMVKLKAEYQIEIVDLNQDPQYQLEQAIAKRKAEYPSAEEFMNAFFDGGEEALAALQAKRLEIKTKYPKP